MGNEHGQMPLDSLLSELLKDAKVQELIALPESAFNIAAERIRRCKLK
jgi:hypothetical protein